MKKSLILIYFSVFVCAAAVAQTETTTTSTTTKNEKFYSKRGVYILPEEGEFALGIDALPLLRYAGNLMSGANNNTPGTNFTTNPLSLGYQAIYAKKMLSDSKALRVRLGLLDQKNTDLYPVVLSSLTPDPLAPQYDNDKVATLDQGAYLSVGIEKRRGKSRIQGLYGAEVIFGCRKTQTNYIYANSMNVNFAIPKTFNDAAQYINVNQRLIEDNTSSSIFGGIRAFAGVEFFFAPKASIGGEFGYALIAQSNGIRERIYEYWDGGSNSVKKISNQSRNGSLKSIGLSTDNLNASINLFLYF